MPMSVFENAFSSAASTLMSVFGETSPATYIPETGVSQSLSVMVDRGVKDSESTGLMVNITTTITWRKSDRSQHSRKDVITLATGESFRLNKLLDGDGMFITYQVTKA